MVKTWAGLDLSMPIVMGILNVTPDSFSDGGHFQNWEKAVAHAESMLAAGAKIIDIGGESTRPGAMPPSVEEETQRVVPVIQAVVPIAKQCGARISVDTRRVRVMAAAVAAGAEIINDVSALSFDPDAVAYVAEHQLPVILCHARGTPADMQQFATYNNVAAEVRDELEQRITACMLTGIAREKICIDPGIGFAKTTAQNVALLQNLSTLQTLGVPLLVGLSRKRMIGDITHETQANNRLGGSLAGALFAITRGANILRVHDVAETMQAITVWQALQGA